MVVSLSGGVCAILSWLGRTGWERISLPVMKGGAYLCNLNFFLLSGNLKNANSRLLLHNIRRDTLRLCFQPGREQKHYKMCASNTMPLEKKGFLTNSGTRIYYLEGEFSKLPM